jgi:hypothetical protein
MFSPEREVGAYIGAKLAPSLGLKTALWACQSKSLHASHWKGAKKISLTVLLLSFPVPKILALRFHVNFKSSDWKTFIPQNRPIGEQQYICLTDTQN